MQANREFVLTILAPVLVFLSGFLTYIFYHGYGILTPEVLLCILAIGLAGICIGGLLAVAGPTNLRAIGFAMLLFVFLDIQFRLVARIHDFLVVQDGRLLKYAIVVLLLFGYQLVFLGLRRHIATILTTVFATAILATAILPAQKAQFGPQPVAPVEVPVADLPPIIHVVLDGHIGIEGIPVDIGGGEALRDSLREFFGKWGFRLYGRAYSKYFMTYDSISNLINGKASAIDADLVDITTHTGKPGWKPAQNEYFRKLADRGYRIRVYQTDYLDFCQDFSGKIEYCYRYPSSSPQLVRALDLPAMEKAELIIGSYTDKSAVVNMLRILYNKSRSLIASSGLPGWERKNYAFSSLGVPEVIRQLQTDLSQASRGRLFFAHLLLPHGPYIWDETCRMRDDSDTWLSRRLDHEDLLSHSNPEYREKAYGIYFQQVVCTMSLLDNLLESLDKNGLLENATVIIHGDHGSRITINDPVAPMEAIATDRDYIDAFSTLFAIRSPGITPGYHGETRAIQHLFAELVMGMPASEEDGTVFLQSGQFIQRLPMEQVSMPVF